jgi:hypothetical protein
MTIALDRPLIRHLAHVGAGLAVALAVPFIVHLVPVESGPPLGARLLPIFFASLVLVVRGAPLPALAVAMLAPLVNRAITGMPAGPMLPTLQIELLVFTALLIASSRAAPRLPRFAGPVAYLAAATTADLLLDGAAPSLAAIGAIVTVAWPGLLTLLAVGVAAGAGRTQGRAST